MKMRTFVLLSWTLAMMAGPATSAADADTSDTGQFKGFFKKNFQFHGYLSVAFADLNLDEERPLTSNENILGIPEDGTASYGNAALFLRYAPVDRHSFVLQLSSRELGDSPVDEVEDAVDLDWLFWEYQPADNTRIRLGRVPTAVGIFNEIRDVGVLLPFYRPPHVFYRQGSLFSETVDGLAVSQRFLPTSEWSLDLDLYYGEFELLEQGVGFIGSVREVDVSDVYGGQLWLDTPVSGLRLGLGAQSWDVGAESRFNFEETNWSSWYFSVEGLFEHFVTRAEFRHVDTSTQSSPASSLTDIDLEFYYVQLGWLINDRWSLYVQSEVADIIQFNSLFVGGDTEFREREDFGVSLVYKLSVNLAVKAEYHDTSSETTLRTTLVVGPSGPQFLRTYRDIGSDYSIVSLSVSF